MNLYFLFYSKSVFHQFRVVKCSNKFLCHLVKVLLLLWMSLRNSSNMSFCLKCLLLPDLYFYVLLLLCLRNFLLINYLVCLFQNFQFFQIFKSMVFKSLFIVNLPSCFQSLENQSFVKFALVQIWMIQKMIQKEFDILYAYFWITRIIFAKTTKRIIYSFWVLIINQ